MSQLADIMSLQKSLEETFTKKMGELKAQIQSAAPTKDTVAKVAEEFRTFRELVFRMFGLLRSQINECALQLDGLESRNRRKVLIFQGLAEAKDEDSSKVILSVIKNKLAMPDVTAASIKLCHRLGAVTKEHHRPILVKFMSHDVKSAVWRAKTRLKGSNISVREFLTKARQLIFGKARQHFGMRSCWTLDGVILVKAQDGSKHRIISMDELNTLLTKHPKASNSTPTSKRHTVKGGDNLQTGKIN